MPRSPGQKPFDLSTGSLHRRLKDLPIPKFVEPVETNPDITSTLERPCNNYAGERPHASAINWYERTRSAKSWQIVTTLRSDVSKTSASRSSPSFT